MTTTRNFLGIGTSNFYYYRSLYPRSRTETIQQNSYKKLNHKKGNDSMSRGKIKAYI